MVRKCRWMMILCLAWGTIMGCASTAQYSQLAQAGTNYYTALDNLLVKAGDLYIDTDSERLLATDASYQADFQAVEKQHPSPVKLEDLRVKIEQNLKKDYDDKGMNDKENQKIISKLRAHAALLSSYFTAMNQLASSSAPTNIGKSIGTIATQLQTTGNLLRLSAPNPGIFQQLVPLAVNIAIKGALRKELEERNLVIQTELLTQQQLLAFLGKQIQNNLTLTRVIREKRLVHALLSFRALDHADSWIANRRQLMEWQNTVKELGAAQAVAKNLLQAYQSMVSGTISLAQFDGQLLTLKPALVAAESLSK